MVGAAELPAVNGDGNGLRTSRRATQPVALGWRVFEPPTAGQRRYRIVGHIASIRHPE